MGSAYVLAVAAALIGAGAVVASGVPLADFVARPDDAFDYEVVSAYRVDGATVYNVQLVSQTWRDIPWTHWLTLISPDQLQQRQKALLVIGGGVNTDGPPPRLDQAGSAAVEVARQTGSIAAIVSQVPNQPLMGGKYEDDLIAHTFIEYLDDGDPDQVALFPMVKSAVRAMDAVQALAHRHAGASIQQFVLTGGSKRGWTTYLTAAVDGRVAAIAPMVIDTLDMPAQLEHQRRTYGDYSPQIRDYTERGIQDRVDTPEGQDLVALVDPYQYREAFTMPKLVLLGTNDPFWTVDSANLYWDDLPGPKWLHYEANAGHGLGEGSIRTLAAFHAAMTTDKAMPALKWERSDDALTVSWENAGGQAFLWQAWSESRDFRQAQWTHQRIDRPRGAVARVEKPEHGWTAAYVEVLFPDGPLGAYGLTTQMIVLPETFPHE